MLACCVAGCGNLYSPRGSIPFYRIPTGFRPHNRRRRRLWVEAIKKANGSSGEELQDGRVCGAHFISGHATMDADSRDFVPSVFTSTKETQKPKKRVKRFYGSRKRWSQRGKAETCDETPVADLPADLPSPVLMEVDALQEMEKPSDPSELKEREILCEEALTETVQSETSSIQNVTPPSAKAPTSIQKMNPFVLLKPLITPAGGFRCDVCTETLVDVPALVKHKRVHEEPAPLVSGETDVAEPHTVPADQPSFPCNMCDRSFTTTQKLKRHKLLHLKDGRKCPKCGVLFCRLHNHILFQPQPEGTTVFEEDSFTDEEQKPDNDDESQEKNVSDKLEPTRIVETVNEAQTTQTPPEITAVKLPPLPPMPPLPPIPELLPRAPPLTSYTRASSLAYVNFSKDPGVSDDDLPQLPPSLQIFSPQYLTSALLEVRRNYDYILNKTERIKINSIVKVEPEEPALTSPCGETIKQAKREKIAYDLEVIL
ncbi:zinc finger protein 48-like [Cololabis saira]|uniref:zinc finger protein 48-like n=1 Tax=Cololabis saira TaxID=129043 RepID=UPI002AD55F55|nr:zinc finger protein 48-like [Cololabis saira]